MRKSFKIICKCCGVEILKFFSQQKFCSHKCALNFRRKNGLLNKPVPKGDREFVLNERIISYIDGLLAGDGCIQKSSKHAKNYRYTQSFALRYKEWAEQIVFTLASWDIKATLQERKIYDKRTKKTYDQVILQTLCYKTFAIFRSRWYSDGKKQIPDDIQTSYDFFKNWYLSDGCLTNRISFAVHCFDQKSVDKLMKVMKNVGYHPFYYSNCINLCRKREINRFLSKLKYIPGCFEYKLKNYHKLNLCFDLDGTIVQKGSDYSNLKPIEGMSELIRELKSKGHKITIYTARNMNTYGGNLGLITFNQVPVITDWLQKNNIPIDELYIGKPNADAFIDDKGIHFSGNVQELREKLDQLDKKQNSIGYYLYTATNPKLKS